MSEQLTINEVRVGGAIGSLPQYKVTATGTPFANFSIAMHGTYTDCLGEVKMWTEFAHIAAFGKLLDVLKRLELTLSDTVIVAGEMRTKKYLCKKTGVEKYITEVIAHHITLVKRADHES